MQQSLSFFGQKTKNDPRMFKTKPKLGCPHPFRETLKGKKPWKPARRSKDQDTGIASIEQKTHHGFSAAGGGKGGLGAKKGGVKKNWF